MSVNGEDWADASTRPTSPTLDTASAAMDAQPQSQPEASTSQHKEAECKSSADSLPAELTLKCCTQVSRLESLQTFYEEMPTCAPNITLHEVQEYTTQVNEIHQAFMTEHAYRESKWPALLIEHVYFTSDTFTRESRRYSKLKLKLSRIKEELDSYNCSQASDQESNCSQVLPAITVPSFNGDFRKCSEFSERFTELIIKEAHFNDNDRLRCLRSSLKEASAHLVAQVSDSKLTFNSAWEWLAAQYQNRRAIIKQQLDKLQVASPLTSSSADSLRKLLTMAQEIKLTLTSLCKADIQNCMLVHQVWSKLDSKTREAWETSLESSLQYPEWASLEKFILNRANTLEKGRGLPSPLTKSNSSSHRENPKVSAQASTTQAQHSGQDNSYLCDCCNSSHFIVMCPRFRQMTVSNRRKLITEKLLCRNCCGRHSTVNCKSQQKCKLCQAAHHTMLHLKAAPARQGQTQH